MSVTVKACNGLEILLTDERWDHIIRGHPEMRDKQAQVLETLADANGVRESQYEPDAWVYVRYYRQIELAGRPCYNLTLWVPVNFKTREVKTAHFNAHGVGTLGKRVWP